MGFLQTGVSTGEPAKGDSAQVLALSDVDEADNVEESEGEAPAEPNTKFTIWDV